MKNGWLSTSPPLQQPYCPLATVLSLQQPLLFVIPSEAEGSAAPRTLPGNVLGFLLGYDGNRDGNGMGRHAGVGITGLVVQASFEDVLSWLRRQVGVENELTGVN